MGRVTAAKWRCSREAQECEQSGGPVRPKTCERVEELLNRALPRDPFDVAAVALRALSGDFRADAFP